MAEYWLVFDRHDSINDVYLSLTVGPVHDDQLAEHTGRKITIPFDGGEYELVLAKTFDHEPAAGEMDKLAPPGHRSTDDD